MYKLREVIKPKVRGGVNGEVENSSRKHSCFIDGSHYIFDTHAHYFHRRFANMPDGMDREELLKRVYESNIRKCIVPAINYWTNMEIKRLFDKPEYEWIYYAHGSHPKYLWKEIHEWNDERWKEYEELLSNQKCIAVGETGLDYSYPEFGPTHRLYRRDTLSILFLMQISIIFRPYFIFVPG